MYPPSHEECLQSQAMTEQRNFLYLKFIFDHSPNLCEQLFEQTERSYIASYEALVRKEGHGTPGSNLRNKAVERSTGEQAVVPFVPRLTLSAASEIRTRISEEQKQRLARADVIVDSWQKQREQYTVPDREFWDDYWDGSYRGFRNAQLEMGKLRDDIRKGEFKEGMSRHTLDYLRKELNLMLLASVREWYMKWGELDLHRLSCKDAVEIIQRMLKQRPWVEIRVVAGQRSHFGDDHHSEGILYNLLHRIFDPDNQENLNSEQSSDQDMLVWECQQYIRQNEVEVTFYSNGAAVLLKKKRKPRSSSIRINRSVRSGMLIR